MAKASDKQARVDAALERALKKPGGNIKATGCGGQKSATRLTSPSQTRRLCVTADEAEHSSVQHKRPCSDCPWRRDSLKGWLGSMTVDEWLACAHGDSVVQCHTCSNPGIQCAGIAIYRRNVAKMAIPPSLKLEADRVAGVGQRCIAGHRHSHECRAWNQAVEPRAQAGAGSQTPCRAHAATGLLRSGGLQR